MCVGMGGILEGIVSRKISTDFFEEDFTFNIYNNAPDSAEVVPYQQVVTLEVDKYMSHSNRTLNCEMGFITSLGFMPIEQRTPLSWILSSASQYVDTVLPIDSKIEGGAMAVYCKCTDSSGRTRMKFSDIPHKSFIGRNQYDEFSLNGEHPRLSDIVIYSMRYPQPNAIMYRVILDALDRVRHIYEFGELKHILSMLSTYIDQDDTWVKDNQ